MLEGDVHFERVFSLAGDDWELAVSVQKHKAFITSLRDNICFITLIASLIACFHDINPKVHFTYPFDRLNDHSSASWPTH